MIERRSFLQRIEEGFDRGPVVALLGPRQCGKTTLARAFAAERDATYFDLEDPRDLARLSNPILALRHTEGIVVLDEIQRKPELLEVLRVIVDQPRCRSRFLVLGSASPRLVESTSESLAGRVAFVDLAGFNVTEVGGEAYERLWLRGGFPRSFLARGEEGSYRWRNDFIRTFLEREIPQLGIAIPAETLRRFWTMLAHYHGRIWNAAEFARSLGASEAKARRYLDVLSGAYMVRPLPPWFENLKKRQIKSPKIYIRDSGLLHALLGLEDRRDLLGHPKLGASWEGFAIEQILAILDPPDPYFWATHAGAELDLLIFRKGRRIGFEVKCVDAPRITKSMRIAIRDLGLQALHIVYPGEKSFPIDEQVYALSVPSLQEALSADGH